MLALESFMRNEIMMHGRQEFLEKLASTENELKQKKLDLDLVRRKTTTTTRGAGT
jgi:hypothetical protein